MAERDAHRTEEVFGRDTIGIPIGNSIGRFRQFISFTIRERECLISIFHMQFSLRFDTIDRLVMQHTAVVAEKGAVATRDINQHRREAIITRARLAPERRPRPPRVPVTTATGITRIDRAKSSYVRIVTTGTHVVVKPVTRSEPVSILPGHPTGLRIVGDRRLEEGRGSSSRQGIAIGNHHLVHIHLIVLLASQKKRRQSQ